MKDPKGGANKENRACPHSPKPKSKVAEQQSPISHSKQKRTLTPVNTNVVEKPIVKSKSKIEEKPILSVSPKPRTTKPIHTRQATLIIKDPPK